MWQEAWESNVTLREGGGGQGKEGKESKRKGDEGRMEGTIGTKVERDGNKGGGK